MDSCPFGDKIHGPDSDRLQLWLANQVLCWICEFHQQRRSPDQVESHEHADNPLDDQVRRRRPCGNRFQNVTKDEYDPQYPDDAQKHRKQFF